MTPRRKKLVFSVILLALLYLFVEGLSCAVYYVHQGRFYSGSELEARKAAIIQKTAVAPGQQEKTRLDRELKLVTDALARRVLHPYVGFVLPPGQPPPDLSQPRPVPFSRDICEANNHGFMSTSPFLETPADHVRVVIAGGSVANLFYCLGRGALIKELQTLPRFQGKTIDVIALAVEGYKQPQQALALLYYLILGGKPDLLITLDGFNEIALIHGAFLPYPEQWTLLVSGSQKPERQKLLGQMALFREWQGALAARAQGLDYSVFFNLLWSLSDQALEARILQTSHRLQQQIEQDKGHSFMTHGPDVDMPNPERPGIGARIWAEGTLAMHRLARASGFPSFHFLQPTLHMAGSKPFTSEEQGLKNRESAYREDVPRGYPLLVQHVATLKAQGVQAHDLTGVFKDISETLYTDDCCHFNKRGNEILAMAMAQIINTNLEPAPP